ncbi:ATP-dependent nuclease [Pontibacter fetidus]|uniref:AAA family ATPase n=1 Tax=Pontibacter fetidus TaxID=2700082 RepID=A0A6B2GVE3_9BACT|nr:AAA family ATPase [Pontibacter fetidus]NDK54775.1 AAA family ATPase [Pontibacter fetidus]
MYLAQLLIVNYRSCQLVNVSFNSNKPNVFIGANDCGKSTVLKAIGLLLDQNPSYKYGSDLSSQRDLSNSALAIAQFDELLRENGLPSLAYSEQETIILGKFKLEADDTELSYQAYSEQLRICRQFSEDDSIWMLRSFSCETGTHSTYVLCKERQSEEDLWALTEARLRTLNSQLGIRDEDIDNVNGEGRPSKYERIKAVYVNHSAGLLQGWSLYGFKREDRPAFPEFRYLDWRCSLEDIKKQADDLLTSKINTAFQEVRESVAQIAQDLENEINQELRENLLEELTTVVPSLIDITAKLSPPVIKPSVTDILVEKSTSEGLIHIESQGEGVKRQIWYGLLRAQARRLAERLDSKKEYIWAFDEPETHLYPGAQREFFDLLRDATSGGVQVILSTHSTIFVDKTNLSEIKKTVLFNGYTQTNTCEDVEDVYDSLKLRNSDFLFHDKFLVVEGQTEYNLFPALYRLHTGRTLLQDNIQVINMKGSGNEATNQRLFTSLMDGFKKNTDSIVYIFDRDQKAVKDRTMPDAVKYYLGRQDLEDSIAPEVWANLINDLLSESTESNEIRVSAEDIRALIESIPSENTNADNKLHKKLSNLYRSAQTDSVSKMNFPGKSETGMLLCRYITSMQEVCPQLSLAFDTISPARVGRMPDEVVSMLNELDITIEGQ